MGARKDGMFSLRSCKSIMMSTRPSNDSYLITVLSQVYLSYAAFLRTKRRFSRDSSNYFKVLDILTTKSSFERIGERVSKMVSRF
jgi:hypothetical protein